MLLIYANLKVSLSLYEWAYNKFGQRFAPRPETAVHDRFERLHAHVQMQTLVFGHRERERNTLMCLSHFSNDSLSSLYTFYFTKLSSLTKTLS